MQRTIDPLSRNVRHDSSAAVHCKKLMISSRPMLDREFSSLAMSDKGAHSRTTSYLTLFFGFYLRSSYLFTSFLDFFIIIATDDAIFISSSVGFLLVGHNFICFSGDTRYKNIFSADLCL